MRIIDKEKLKIISSQKIKEKNHWLENLSGELKKTSFPCDYRNLKAKEFSREIMAFAFPRELFSTLMQVSKASDIRLYIILAAAAVILLKKYTGSSDIILASPIYKQQTGGEFINTLLVLRNRLHQDMTFKELLHQVGQTVKNANENQNYPLETLMEQLNIPFPGNECSLFDTAVLLENIHDRQYIRHIDWNMILSFLRTEISIKGTIEYNSKLYKKTTIERMVSHLKNLLYHVLRHPNLAESDITILSEDERKQLLFDFNDTCAQYPGDKVISTLFTEQVKKGPHHTAITCEDANLTYEELDKRANHAAGGLREKGVAAGTIVGLLLDRSLEMITTILAILKAGGAYLPIDPDYPGERIRYMLEDSSAKILVTVPGLAEIFEKLSIVNCQREIACSAQSNSPLERGASSTHFKEFGGGGVCLNSQSEANPSNLAYIIYTSGTTGKPKGVLIENRNVVRLLFNHRFQFDFNAFDTWTMFHSYCFDFSVWEMYGALLYGGQLVVIPKWMTRDPAGYLGILKQGRVTVLNQTPTAFYNLAAEELKQPGKALRLKYVIFGGEALNPLQLKDWKEKYPETKLINMFGITETTVHVTYKEIGQREIRLNISNIGTPIPTLCTYVMDKNLALKPIGAAGEMCVGGEGVGRGYLNQPELTKEKFVENPHKTGERVYKSGDLVKLSETGEMEYLGRIDHQVQVRGFRVELGEIQAHLLKHEEIKEALVLALEGESGDKSLCAYIVSHKDLEVSALREYLSGELPDYMIPAHFVRVEQVPLTSNGKVDRKALPHPKTSAPGTVYTAPRNEIEETLASIWTNQLGLERVGIHEDYFNIGGDSIKAIKLLNSINDAFQINLKIVDLFAHETIEKLAQRITRDETGYHHSLDMERKEALQEIEALKTRIIAALPPDEHIEDIYPMSDIEKGMVYYTLKDPADAAYHDQMVFHVKYRDFNPQTFKRALHLMAKKHPILRTSFHIEDYEEPVQMVRKSIPIDMEHLDISYMNREEQTVCLNQFLIEDRKRGFDLAKALLWRIRTFQLADEYVCMGLVTHHAVMDGWSVAAFLTELNNTYLKLKIEPDFVPGKLESTYKEFIVEQILEKKKYNTYDYWRNELENYKRLDFLQRKQGDTFTTAKGYSLNLGKNLLEELKDCAIKWNTTLKNLCLAAYIYMLNMVSYENDIVVGIVTSGRPVCEDGDKILGCFLNTVPFRLKIPGSKTWAQFIEIVNRKQLELAVYNRISLFEILRILGENPRDINPIFDTIFNLIDFHIFEKVKYEKYEKYQENSSQPLPVDSYVKTNTLLDFNVDLTLGGFNISVNYTNSSFSQEDIQTLCDYFFHILKAFVSRPHQLMGKDKIISRADKEKLLYAFNQTGADYPQASLIHELFEQQVEQTPDHTALFGQKPNPQSQIQFSGMHLSYRELNEQSNRLAHLLREKGVKSDIVVGIMVERSIEMIIGIFAVVKAGGAYLPIDPDYPRKRIQYMLADSGTGILVTTRDISNKCTFETETIYLSDAINHIPTPSHLHLSPAPVTCLAYVTYTSGSTGKLKGVMVEHRGVVNIIYTLFKEYPFSKNDVYLMKTSYTFDVSVSEIFGWFGGGGRMVMLAKGGEKDPEKILDTIERQCVSHINFVPSMFGAFVDFMDPETVNNDGLSTIKYIFLAGEALPPEMVNKFRKRNNNILLENIYGPTEATIYASKYSLHHWDGTGPIPIGTPLSNISLYILDKQDYLQPIGIVGELYISGAGVARGYLNRPELTAEKFISIFNRSYRSYISKKIYKTGDLARWLVDGNIEFLGRIDDQVKIRGNRVELGEIEGRLKDHLNIKEAAVVVKTKETGNNSYADPYLCAYFVSHTDISMPVSQLREYLQRYLPDYMVPSYYVRLEKMPLTPSGKLNRKALPHPGIASDQPYTAPSSDVEKKLVEIWAQVLNIKQENTGHDVIGIDANFFRLGGHSLTAVILVSKIHKVFDVRISLEELFKIPTIRAIAAHVKAAQPDKFFVIQPLEQKEYYLLSFSQRRLYFLHRMDETGTAYNIPSVMRLHGDIEGSKLEKTIARLIQRHESLRTSFLFMGGEPLQKIHHHVAFEIQYYNLVIEGAERAAGIIENFIKPFDLSRPPLLRVGLIKTTEKEHILVMDMHHIIADGVSFTLLTTDFMRLYGDMELPRLSLRYKDFSHWQRMESEKKSFKQQEAFWVREFKGDVPVLNLPTDVARPVIRSLDGSTRGFRIDGETSEALKKCALQQGTTLYMVLLALYYVFLAKITNQEDIVIGTPVAGRRHADLEHIIGMFVNTLALRNYPIYHKTFKEFLTEVKEKTLASLENQDYPFEDLIEKVYNHRDTGRNPLFDTVFVMQELDLPRGSKKEIPGLKVLPYEYRNKTAKFDLTLWAVREKTGLYFEFEYCTRLFNHSTVERFTRYFQNISSAVSQNIQVKLSGLEILSQEERHQLLVDFNDTAANYPNRETLHQLFTEQVERVPDNIALHGGMIAWMHGENVSITYKELNQKSHQLARWLIEKGVHADTIVGIMLERSVEMIIGILGILKAGGAYLPIGPDYPPERIKYMLKDSGTKILVTTPEISERTGIVNSQLSIVNCQRETACSAPSNSPLERGASSTSFTGFGGGGVCLNLQPAAKPSNLAYIIYTSGTTGKPKGSLIEHKNVVRLMFNDRNLFDFGKEDVWTMFHSFCFDFSVWEMYGALLYGGLLVVVPLMTAKDPQKYLELLKHHQVTVLNQTPPAFYNLAREEMKHPTPELRLRYVIFGGEALKPLKLRQWQQRYPNTKLINMFGITETTVHVTYKEIGEPEINLNTNNIGKPIPTLTALVMDNHLQLLPIGTAGELCVGGEGVCRGYLNRPHLTAEKFAPSPHHPGKRLYRSGDLGKWLGNGDIEYLGRIDHQVKIRGYRIELGEIESHLLEHQHIKEAVVLDQEQEDGDKRLCAYIVPDAAAHLTDVLTSSQLREYLSSRLPDYMIPALMMPIEQIPLTPNGKLDRNALPAPAFEPKETYVAPGNRVEESLVETWSEVLGIEKNSISVNANFFELGGHSLKAITLLAKLQKKFNVKIPLEELFTTPFIKGLSKYLSGAVSSEFVSIEPVEKKEFYPLSPAQKRLYVLYRMDIDSIAYNMPLNVVLEGELKRERLQETFKKLAARHENLRTSFHMTPGAPIQRVRDTVQFDIEYDDFQVTTIENFSRPFDLSRAPLLRIGLIKIEEKKYILSVDMHHIISDGVSHSLLTRDFERLYKEERLSPLRIQYKDYSQWQHRENQKEEVNRQKTYWLKEFAGEIPVLQAFTDYPRPGVQSFEGNILDFEINKHQTAALNHFARQQGATLYMVLLAAFALLLAKISGQEDIVIGTPVVGRRHEDLANIIGVFINTLALRNFPGGEKTFTTFLAEVKRRTLQAFETQDYPFEELVGFVSVTRDVSRNPMFDVLFSLQNLDPPGFQIPGLSITPYQQENRVTKFDLTLEAVETAGKLMLQFGYWTRLYKQETIKRFAAYFCKIAASILDDPNKELCQIEITAEEEKRKLLFDFNNTYYPYPQNKTIHELFEEQVEKTPGHIALIGVGTRFIAPDPGKQIIHVTYLELNRKSHQLACWLQEKGVLLDTIAAIMMDRSLEMIIGIFAILKAGGAYLPIDPDYPEERINYMLADSGAEILLTTPGLSKEIKYKNEVVHLTDAINRVPTPPHLHLSPAPVTCLAYIIYTSGSTGKPKGVMVRHSSVINVLYALHTHYPFREADAYLLKTSYTFDVSAAELFGWFLGGGKLAVLEKHGEKDPGQILAAIASAGITHINFVPSMFKAFLEGLNPGNIHQLSGLKYIFLAGEALMPEMVTKFRRLHTDIILENIYGPTEGTIYSSKYSLSDWDGSRSIPIGKPMPNMKLYILNKDNRLQAVGIPGELCVGGRGVARGYLNKPQLTAERFLTIFNRSYKTYRSHISKKIYRTGDLVRWLPDGNIEFLGRMDHQVKIRGFRIELGEIENQLMKNIHIKESVVMERENKDGYKYLAAYVVSGADISVPGLRTFLSNRLPEYMLPTYFVQLDQLPLTPNGKIDRKSLPAPEETALGSGVEYSAPTNEIEELLVKIWGKVLGRNPIGIHDNFFTLGGDSIKAIQIVSMMAKTGYKIEMRDIFQSPGISGLASRVVKVDRTPDQSPVTGIVPLTPIQRAFFTTPRKYPHHYNQSVMLYSKDGFAEEAVIAIFTKIQQHHDALRMVYVKENGKIIQKNAGLDTPLSLQVFDFRDRVHEGRKEVKAALACEVNKIQASIDLQKGPLLKLALFHMAEGDRLLVAIHHLVIDGVSWRILFEDIETLYQQYIKKEPLQLPLKTDSFKPWAEKLSEYANSPLFLKQKAYWTKLESLEIPPITKDFDGENYLKDKKSLAFTLDKDQTEHLLTKINEAFATEINDILLTALGLSARKTFGTTKVLIALEGHGREEIIKDINISRTVGWFTSLYPVVLDMSYENDLSRQIKEIKENLHQVPDRGIGYGILEYLTADENKNEMQFKLKPRVSFNYLGQFDRDAERVSFGIDNTSVGNLQDPGEQGDYELDVSGLIANKELVISVTFNKKQFKTEVIKTLLDYYREELNHIISFCISREKKQRTPSDFTYKELTIEQLDSIFDE